MRRMLLAGAFAAGSLFVMGASPASAACGAPLVDTGVVYVTDDEGGVWIYAESNGQPGLQRGGVTPIGETAPCGGENPDTVVI
ncbi:MAG TPA: hypothetical protein VNB24_04915 [Acidimicrobiales bacterium]|nr:hypothetical protein [Acidimicrobiales bacterium]